MRRRTLLRLGGAAAVGASLATVGLSKPSAAQTALSLSIAGTERELSPDDAIAAVQLDCTVEWAYELPDGVTPEVVVVELAAGSGDGLTTVASSESPSLFGEADGSESFSADLLSAGVLTTDQVRASVEVDVEARLRVEDSTGDVLARETATDSATVSAETTGLNATQYGEVGGSGELRIETV